MIGYLKGKIISVKEGRVILNSNNVGWEVFIDSTGFLVGQEAEFFIHTQVKETEISLWGFKSEQSLDIFKILINISGIGTKTALALITTIGPRGLYDGIALNDPSKLKVPGIGKKTAEKIILELKDKLDQISLSSDIDQNSEAGQSSQKKSEVVDALISLGYRPFDINKNLDNLAKNKDIQEMSVSDIIKEILKTI